MMKRILLFTVLLFPCLCRGEVVDVETGNGVNGVNVEWGVAGAVNVNIPGDWTTTDTGQEINLSYGGAIGGVCNVGWKSGWFVEPGVMIGYDNIKLGLMPEGKTALRRWNLSGLVTAGHRFSVAGSFHLSPLMAAEVACYFSTSSTTRTPEPIDWRPVNASCGIGVGLSDGNMAINIIGYFGLVKMSPRQDIMPHCKSLYSNKVVVSYRYYFTAL